MLAPNATSSMRSRSSELGALWIQSRLTALAACLLHDRPGRRIPHGAAGL